MNQSGHNDEVISDMLSSLESASRDGQGDASFCKKQWYTNNYSHDVGKARGHENCNGHFSSINSSG